MSTMIDIRRLRTVNKLAHEGATTVADHLSQLTGLDTEMQITKINVLDACHLGTHIGEQRQVGVNVPVVDPPHGSVLLLFDDASARRLAGTMLSEETNDGGRYTQMERSAIREVGNIVTSGFIDGWADVLDETIDISTPQLVRASGHDIVEYCIDHGAHDIALTFDSRLRAPDADVEATIYSFPNIEEFVTLINSIDL